jgi:hypothetical protein
MAQGKCAWLMKDMKDTKKKATKKAMKKKAMKKVSKIAKGKGAKAAVFRGSKEKTQGGLTKDSLMKNKCGKVVSKAQSATGKKNYKNISAWTKAFLAARATMVICDTAFIPCGGQTEAGKKLLMCTRFIYERDLAMRRSFAVPF